MAEITLSEKFATAIQKDITTMGTKIATMADTLDLVVTTMATKDDLWKLRQDMATREELRELREDIKRITDVMVSKADLEALRDELILEIRSGKTVEELRERLAVVEGKLGIKHGL